MSGSGTRKPILVRGARQLLTLRGPSGPRRGAAMRELGVIQDGALLIVDGIIRDIGPSRRVENLAAARNADEISADGRVVMPGFVDSRTHLVCGPPLLDEYEHRISGQENGGGDSSPGSDRTLQALRTASKQRLELDARKTLREFVRHGTTSLEATATFDPEARSEMKVLRVLSAVCDKPLDVIPTFQVRASGLPDGTEQPANRTADDESGSQGTLQGLRTKRLARFVDVTCGPTGLPQDEVRRLVSAARELGFQVSVTTDLKEPADGVCAAVELNAIRISQIECITAAEIELLARSATIATLLPGTAFHTQCNGQLPGRDLIDRGAAVAIASDFSADTCPTCSMPAILSLACNQMRLTPAEAITAATINGAHALRCGNRFGSLEYGKEADLLMLSVSDYREIPYHFGMSMIAMCMKRGDVLFPRMDFS